MKSQFILWPVYQAELDSFNDIDCEVTVLKMLRMPRHWHRILGIGQTNGAL